MFSGTTTEEAHEPLFVTDLHSSATPSAMSVPVQERALWAIHSK